MQLYLLRHADAATPAEVDAVRRLSDKGVDQARRVGRFCKSHEILPEIFLTSPLVRARETAEHVARELNIPKADVAAFLASGMRPETALAELKTYEKFTSVMIVGHEPDFSMLIAHLVGLPGGERLRVRKASLTLLDVPSIKPGAGRLDFSIPCKLM